MQAIKHPASAGWNWVIGGIRLWRKAPLALTMAAITMTMVLSAGFIPFFGLIALPMVLAPLEVGMFMICAAADHGKNPQPAILFSGFRRNLSRLIALGGIRLGSTLIVLTLAVWISDVDLSQAKVLISGDAQAAENFAKGYIGMVAWFFVLRAPLEMADWYAPLFVGMRGVPVIKSLFFSFMGCWRNLTSLSTMLAAYAVLVVVLPSLVMSVLASAAPALAPVFSWAVLVVAVPVFYASYYRSAVAIFGEWI